MRSMPVLVIGIITISLPLLQLSPLPDFIWRKILLHAGNRLLVLTVSIKCFCSIKVILEEIPYELLVMHYSIFTRTMFR